MATISPAFLLLAIGMIASIEATPIINSPTTLVQCQPAALSWTDATPPVYISAVEGTNTAATPLINFQPQSEASGSLTWSKVNITQGETLTFIINDAKGVNNFSGQVTVKPGNNDCTLIGSGTTSGSGSAASSGSTATTPSAAGSGTSSGSTGGSSTSGSSTSSPSSSTTSSPSASSSSHNTSSTGSASTSSNTGSTTKPSTSSTTTTSGSAALGSSTNTVIVGTVAAVAGVLIATGLF